MKPMKGEEGRGKGEKPVLLARFLPRTLLVRTFLLIAALSVLSTAAWMGVFRLYAAEPRARDTAQMAASVVNLVRAALLASAPEKRLDFYHDLRTLEGIRLLPLEREDQIAPLPEDRFLKFLETEVKKRLGPRTRVALSVNGIPGFWISFALDGQGDADDDYWVILPRTRTQYELTWQWLTWGALALGLSLLFAWFIASRLSRPLARLAHAATAVGRGQKPAPLNEEGADELKQLAGAFNRMTADLESNERERAEVLAGISHDLRTPLTRLRLEAELSVAEEPSRQAIIADLEQMEAVIAQFLDYARGEEGEPEATADPGALLEEILARQNRPGRQISAQIAPLPACSLRPKALLRAMDNLIDNAFKYGGKEVACHASLENGAIQIDVLDRGPGIAPEDTERAKRPFIRLNAARGGTPGTGLGLAIVERIAQLHGGRFELLPRQGGGLIARLILPCGQKHREQP